MTKNEVKLNFPLKQGENVELSVTEDGKAIEISAPVDWKIEQALADSKEYTDTKVEELKNDPDIVNIVQTKEDLDALSDNYLAGLGNNDIIRVLQSSEGGSRGYYKWHKTIPQPTQPPYGYFEFVGDVDDYYSKEESDEKFSTIEETEIIKSRLDNVEDLTDELSDTKLDKVEDLGSSELVYAQKTGVQKMITAEVVEQPNTLIKRSGNSTAFIKVPIGNDIDPLYIANVGYVDSKTVVVNSSSYTTLDDSETTVVPALTVEQVATIYNAIVAGKKVYVRDNSGDIEILFTEREKNSTDDIDILSVGCTYMGKLTLSYSIVGETVQVSYKEIGQGISGVEWGDIGGDIKNQASLMEELNKKIEADDSFVTDPLDNRYLKDATVSNGTLTLTKQDNTTVEFQGGGGGKFVHKISQTNDEFGKDITFYIINEDSTPITNIWTFLESAVAPFDGVPTTNTQLKYFEKIICTVNPEFMIAGVLKNWYYITDDDCGFTIALSGNGYSSQNEYIVLGESTPFTFSNDQVTPL